MFRVGPQVGGIGVASEVLLELSEVLEDSYDVAGDDGALLNSRLRAEDQPSFVVVPETADDILKSISSDFSREDLFSAILDVEQVGSHDPLGLILV